MTRRTLSVAPDPPEPTPPEQSRAAILTPMQRIMSAYGEAVLEEIKAARRSGEPLSTSTAVHIKAYANLAAAAARVITDQEVTQGKRLPEGASLVSVTGADLGTLTEAAYAYVTTTAGAITSDERDGLL